VFDVAAVLLLLLMMPRERLAEATRGGVER
jgi:hypothetical protein